MTASTQAYMTKPGIGIIILAAGGSSRFGSSKQKLEYEGKSLLRRCAETAVASNCSPVIVVLGANAIDLTGEIGDLPVETVVNPAWASGLSSSIRAGVTALIAKAPESAATVIMLCDQPLVTSNTVLSLIGAHRSSSVPIVACRYEGNVGVPALFASEFFDELMGLEGDLGARSIIKKHAGRSLTIDAPEAALDIDLPDDHRRLRS